MTFTYNSTLPNPPDDPADDVSGMQVNTLSIAQLVAIDHVGFNNADGGQHLQVTFNSNNVPSTPVSPPVLFTNTVNSLPQLFYYSGGSSKSSTQYVQADPGSTFLLGGIIIKWGTVFPVVTRSSTDVNVTPGFPNNFFDVVITANRTANKTNVDTIYAVVKNAGTFTYFSTSGSGDIASFNYIAIGN